MNPTWTLALLLTACPAIAQTPSEIFLLDITTDPQGKISLTHPRNISQHPGYDNQPFFHPSEPTLYYSSFNDDGRADLRAYRWTNKKTGNITQTNEREYSPTVTPDGKHLSCIIQRDNDAQDLGQYPLAGGPAEILIDSLQVGYHAWMNSNELLLFVLGEPMTLQRYNLEKQSKQVLASNIGRSLHRIPGQAKMSFVQKTDDDQGWTIRTYDMRSQQIETLTPTLQGREDLTWTPDGSLLMSDGAQIFIWNADAKPRTWDPIKMPPATLTGITRLAVSPDGKRLALVADE